MRFAIRPLAVLALCLAASAAWALELGDKAPDLDVTAWFGGDPVVLEQCAGKKVVVVEVWATYCDACKKAIPRMAKLAEKYGPAGVEVVAVSDEKADVIKEFLKDGKVKYRVACDEASNTVAPYMRGVRRKEHAPWAFVVDKAGDLVWRGNPSSAMNRAVERALAGKLDAEKAKAIAEAQTAVEDGLDHKNFDQAFADADKLLEAEPGNEKGLLAKLKGFESNKDFAKAKEWVEKTLPSIDDDALALNVVAWTLATSEKPEMRQPSLALRIAKRAVAVSEGADAAILDTYARTLFQAGLTEQAIESQTKAVAADPADEAIKATLDWYKACLASRSEAAPK